jgi:hypothetical protein
MNRRSFFKSVAGFVGTVAVATVPRPVRAAVNRWRGRSFVASSATLIAGEPIAAGTFVFMRPDGRVGQVGTVAIGLAMGPAHKGGPVHVATAGSLHGGSDGSDG